MAEVLLRLTADALPLPPPPAAADALRKAMSDASSSAEYDAFLTHDWGDDELGRSNHARVAEVNRLLKAAGFVTCIANCCSPLHGGASQCARPSTP